MAGFLALFVIGSFWWYFVTVVYIFLAIWSTDNGSLGWSLFTLGAYLAFFSFLGKVNIFTYIFFHPLPALMCVGGYFLVGFGWSFLKWWLFVLDSAEAYKGEMKRFLKEHAPDIPAGSDHRSFEEFISKKSGTMLKVEWANHIQFKDEFKKPVVAKNKERISVWIVYWPFSMVWSFLKDFVRRFVEHLVLKCKKLYQTITNRAYRDTDMGALHMAVKKDEEE